MSQVMQVMQSLILTQLIRMIWPRLVLVLMLRKVKKPKPKNPKQKEALVARPAADERHEK